MSKPRPSRVNTILLQKRSKPQRDLLKADVRVQSVQIACKGHSAALAGRAGDKQGIQNELKEE